MWQKFSQLLPADGYRAIESPTELFAAQGDHGRRPAPISAKRGRPPVRIPAAATLKLA